MVTINSKIRISNTIISNNSATDMYGAMAIDGNSILELYRSQVEGNKAEQAVRTLRVLNSLLVVINSSFKGNSAFQISSILIFNSTAYLENCTLRENRMTFFTGTITTTEGSKLKISNTFFIENEGYDLQYDAGRTHFINIFETHNCLFVQSNISIKSNVKNFKDVAVKEKFIGQNTVYNQTLFKIRETQYASSKLFHFPEQSSLPYNYLL